MYSTVKGLSISDNPNPNSVPQMVKVNHSYQLHDEPFKLNKSSVWKSIVFLTDALVGGMTILFNNLFKGD